LSDSLRREMMLYGIDVVVIEPGTTNTPIKHKFADRIRRYEETDYSPMFASLQAQLAERETTGLPVEKVVAVIVQAVDSEHPKTRYPVPRKWLTSWIIPRFLPDRWLDRLVRGQLGLESQDDSP
jgi:short-subunit dehydrogenase